MNLAVETNGRKVFHKKKDNFKNLGRTTVWRIIIATTVSSYVDNIVIPHLSIDTISFVNATLSSMPFPTLSSDTKSPKPLKYNARAKISISPCGNLVAEAYSSILMTVHHFCIKFVIMLHRHRNWSSMYFN